MKPKSVMVLGAVTAIMVVAAIVAVVGQRAPSTIPQDREYAFAGLLDKVNDVASLKVTSGKDTFVIERTPKGWGLKEKGDYPVSFEKVKGTIVGLAQFRLLEEKTSNPERYERLAVRDPKEKDAKSKRIVLADSGGKVLAEGIIGRQNSNLFGEKGGGTYLRRGNEAKSWLAEGTVTIGPTPNDWMVRDIVNIDAEDVRKVVIVQPDGATLTVHKDDKKQEKFAVDDIPEGRKLKSDNEGKEVAGGLWRLTLEDVKPSSDIEFPEKHHKATYTTFDGLTVTVDMAIIKDDYWGRFAAAADTSGADEEARKKLEAKAKEINDRVTGWTYRISVGEGERLTTKKDTLLEDAKPAKS